MREEKEKALNATTEYLEKLLTAIQEIKNGTSEAAVCRKLGISLSAFRHLLFNTSLGYKGTKPVNPDEFLLSPEEKLYCDVFKLPSLRRTEIPLDLAESIRYVCKQLGQRERRILFYRYWRGYTLRETGKHLDLSGNRIYQIQEEILRKLRRPHFANILRFGLKYIKEEQEVRKARTEKVVSEAIEKLQQECKEAINKNDTRAVMQCYRHCDRFLKEHPVIDGTPMEELGLSTRPVQALYRHGVTTVEELIRFKTIGDLLTIRSMGKNSAEEVREKAISYGIIIEKSNRTTMLPDKHQNSGAF